jgi:hypothetical protein
VIKDFVTRGVTVYPDVGRAVRRWKGRLGAATQGRRVRSLDRRRGSGGGCQRGLAPTRPCTTHRPQTLGGNAQRSSVEGSSEECGRSSDFGGGEKKGGPAGDQRVQCSSSDRQNRGAHGGGGGSVREKKVVVLGRPDERYPLIFIQKNPNRFALIRSKYDSPILEKFQIKYKFVGNKIMNNFPYSNFLKFRIEFELKIREDSRC